MLYILDAAPRPADVYNAGSWAPVLALSLFCSHCDAAWPMDNNVRRCPGVDAAVATSAVYCRRVAAPASARLVLMVFACGFVVPTHRVLTEHRRVFIAIPVSDSFVYAH